MGVGLLLDVGGHETKVEVDCAATSEEHKSVNCKKEINTEKETAAWMRRSWRMSDCSVCASEVLAAAC